MWSNVYGPFSFDDKLFVANLMKTDLKLPMLPCGLGFF